MRSRAWFRVWALAALLLAGLPWTPSMLAAEEGAGEVGSTPVEQVEAEQLPPDVQALVDKAFAALHAGDTTSSMGLFKQALALAPASKAVRLGYGTALIRMLRHREALDLLEPMLAEYPDDYFLRNNLAWLYATSDQHAIRNGDKAVQLAQDALLLAPDDYHVWSTLAEAYYVSARYDKAERAAREALRLGMTRKATKENVDTYKKQLQKSEKARQAMSILE